MLTQHVIHRPHIAVGGVVVQTANKEKEEERYYETSKKVSHTMHELE